MISVVDMSERRVVVIIIALWTTANWLLFFWQGSGEHDTFAMAAAVVAGVQTHQPIVGFAYAPSLQFLYYIMMHRIAGDWQLNSMEILRLMNGVGAICMLVAPFLWYWICRHCFLVARQAEVSVVLLITSPVYFFTVSYGHPFHLALVVTFLSALLLFLSLHRLNGPIGWLSVVMGLCLLSIAMMIRFELAGLLWLLILGLMLYREKRPVKDFVLFGAVLFISVCLFILIKSEVFGHFVLLAAKNGDRLATKFGLLTRSLDPDLIVWGIPHWVTEMGPLLLGAMVWCGIWVFRRGRYGALLAALIGIGPSVLLYIGNPSPPRHFFVAVLGCAAFTAYCLGRMTRPHISILIAVSVLTNLVFPWTLVAIDGKVYPDRADVTYNVIQRTDRNKKQIESVFKLYEEVFKDRSGPVLVLGKWVHIAEALAFLSRYHDLKSETVFTPDNLKMLRLVGRDIDVFLVETSRESEATTVAKWIRSTNQTVRCISFVGKNDGINDFNIEIPKEVYWWNA